MNKQGGIVLSIVDLLLLRCAGFDFVLDMDLLGMVGSTRDTWQPSLGAIGRGIHVFNVEHHTYAPT